MKINKIKQFIEDGFDPLASELDASLSAETNETPKPDKLRMPKDSTHVHIRYGKVYSLIAVLLCSLLVVLMLFTVNNMPIFGSPDTLTDSELTAFYVENGLKDTGAENIITPIILNYRGFDTLGESHVLFIAVCAVLILLRMVPEDDAHALRAYSFDDAQDEPHDDIILKTGARFIFPLIMMFAVYIIVNGNISPGGGFSGGAVLGAGLILYLSAFGYGKIRRFFTAATFKAISCIALMSYSLLKAYHFFIGYNGIESVFGTGTPGTLFSGTLLLLLSICVGLTVASTMYTLFTMFRKGDF